MIVRPAINQCELALTPASLLLVAGLAERKGQRRPTRTVEAVAVKCPSGRRVSCTCATGEQHQGSGCRGTVGANHRSCTLVRSSIPWWATGACPFYSRAFRPWTGSSPSIGRARFAPPLSRMTGHCRLAGNSIAPARNSATVNTQDTCGSFVEKGTCGTVDHPRPRQQLRTPSASERLRQCLEPSLIGARYEQRAERLEREARIVERLGPETEHCENAGSGVPPCAKRHFKFRIRPLGTHRRPRRAEQRRRRVARRDSDGIRPQPIDYQQPTGLFREILPRIALPA